MAYLKKFLRLMLMKINFTAPWWAILFNPFWLSRRELHRCIKLLAPKLEEVVLDFGCGSQPYKNLLSGCKKYIGLEYDTPSNRANKVADIFYNGVTIPLANESIDSILSTQTIEHVPNPEVIFAEWFRILRGGGMFC